MIYLETPVPESVMVFVCCRYSGSVCVVETSLLLVELYKGNVKSKLVCKAENNIARHLRGGAVLSESARGKKE